MKSLIGKITLILAISTTTVLAQTELLELGAKCSVDIITSNCVEGEVSIAFKKDIFTDKINFTLDSTNTNCWSLSIQHKGKLENSKLINHGNAVKSDLVVTHGYSYFKEIGTLTYLNKSGKTLATLNLKRNGTDLIDRYHMTCVPNKLSCDEQCRNEGNPYFPTCHNRCGGW